jgi:hypothetical protein
VNLWILDQSFQTLDKYAPDLNNIRSDAFFAWIKERPIQTCIDLKTTQSACIVLDYLLCQKIILAGRSFENNNFSQLTKLQMVKLDDQKPSNEEKDSDEKRILLYPGRDVFLSEMTAYYRMGSDKFNAACKNLTENGLGVFGEKKKTASSHKKSNCFEKIDLENYGSTQRVNLINKLIDLGISQSEYMTQYNAENVKNKMQSPANKIATKNTTSNLLIAPNNLSTETFIIIDTAQTSTSFNDTINSNK